MTSRVEMGFRFRYTITNVKMTLDTKSNKLRQLIPEDDQEFQKNSANAKIFKNSEDGEKYSADELFTHYRKQTGKELKDFIPEPEIQKAALHGQSQFDRILPITFKTTPFHISTTTGDVAIKEIRLTVRFTIIPQQH